MTKKYKPYRTANNRDIYKKYDNKRNRLENPQKYDNVKLFGFRSGKSYKMIPALLYYVLVISYVLFSLYGEFTSLKFEPLDVVLEIFKYVFILVAVLSPALFLSDFKYIDNIPVFRKHNPVSGFIGILVVILLCYGIMQVEIYCMSDTYKTSVQKYDEEYRKKLEERQKQLEDESLLNEETLTVEETTISIEK